MSEGEGPPSWVDDRLSLEKAKLIDFTKVVTRDELIQSLLGVHQAMARQNELTHILANGSPHVPSDLFQSTLSHSGDILKLADDLMKSWSAENGE